jgi:hypothetical protein
MKYDVTHILTSLKKECQRYGKRHVEIRKVKRNFFCRPCYRFWETEIYTPSVFRILNVIQLSDRVYNVDRYFDVIEE